MKNKTETPAPAAVQSEKLAKIQLLTRRLEMAHKGYSSEKFEDVLLEMERVIFELNTPEGDK